MPIAAAHSEGDCVARIDVIMPQMGESIAEGTLSRWLKGVGDEVKRDEPIFEISTDKVDAEIPAPAAGVLAEIVVQEGQTVPVQAVVARIETEKGAAVGGAGGPAGGAARPPAPAPPPARPPPPPPLRTRRPGPSRSACAPSRRPSCERSPPSTGSRSPRFAAPA